MSVLLKENEAHNKAVSDLAKCEGNFETEKDGWTIRAVTAENKNKEYEKRIKTLSGRYATPEERIQELEEKNNIINLDELTLGTVITVIYQYVKNLTGNTKSN